MSFERAKKLNNLKKQLNQGNNRWYDITFAKEIIDSFEKVPLYKRGNFAEKIIETVDASLKHDKHYKINSNKYMILGMYKEYNKRRWYDRDPITQKAVKKILSMVDQNEDLLKKTKEGIIGILGEYYIRKMPEVEIRSPIKEEPRKEIILPQVLLEDEVARKQEEPKPNHKIMISGEKLFLQKETKKPNHKKNRPKF